MDPPDADDASPSVEKKADPGVSMISRGEKSKLVTDDTTAKSGTTTSPSSTSSSCWTINKSLLAIKAFYFFFIGALGSLAPFIAILLKQYGLSPQQIGVIFGVRPIIGFLSGPLWGFLADRFRLRRPLLLLSLFFWVSVFVALAFIPPPRRLEKCPEHLLRAGAGAHGELEARGGFHQPQQQQHVSNDDADLTELNVTAEEFDLLRENYGWIYEPDDLQKVFLLFMMLILMGEFVQSPTSALSDAATLEVLGPQNINAYGYQRAWGSLGWAITSVSVGALVSMTRVTEVVCSIPLHFSNYFSYVYVFGGFIFCAVVCATLIPFPNETKEKKIQEEEEEEKERSSPLAVFRVFCNVHYGSWMITVFFVGVFNGAIWGFLNWHLDNLGADELLIGVSNVLKCVCEFCMYFAVHRVTTLLGHMGLMYACLASYSVLFLGYAMLVDPWYVLALEVLHGVSFSCVWVSLTAYSTLAVPSSSLATVQGILHGVYFGLGNGTGHLVGGLLIGAFGVPVTYTSMAVASVITGLGLFTAQQCSSKPEGPYQSFDSK